MAYDSSTYKNSLLSKILFILSIIIFVFWLVAQLIDVYRFAVVGAIFESLWLFMLSGLFVLPILSIIFLIKDKFSFRSLYLYTIIISVICILIMYSGHSRKVSSITFHYTTIQAIRNQFRGLFINKIDFGLLLV
jgi:hypothetical protein